jgi:hypothetical protein
MPMGAAGQAAADGQTSTEQCGRYGKDTQERQSASRHEGREDGDDRRVQVEEQCGEAGCGVLQRGEIAERLPQITHPAHRHQGQQIAATWPSQPAPLHHRGHRQAGQRETQEEHAWQVDTCGVGQLGEDRHRAEARRRSDDTGKADEARARNGISDQQQGLADGAALAPREKTAGRPDGPSGATVFRSLRL